MFTVRHGVFYFYLPCCWASRKPITSAEFKFVARQVEASVAIRAAKPKFVAESRTWVYFAQHVARTCNIVILLRDKLLTNVVIRGTMCFNLQSNNVARQVEEKRCPYYRALTERTFFFQNKCSKYIEDITRWREDMNFMFAWQEHKIHIFEPTCNVLFIIWKRDARNQFNKSKRRESWRHWTILHSQTWHKENTPLGSRMRWRMESTSGLVPSKTLSSTQY